jgi:hypothetical protein
MMAPRGVAVRLEDLEAVGRGPWRGSVDQLVDHVGQLGELGLQEIVFEHFCHEEDAIVEWLASEVKPQLETI